MKNAIIFPNLHIYLNPVYKKIDVFGFSIAYYGIVIAVGMLFATFFILREAKRRRIKEDSILDVIIYSIVIGLIGARIYYVAFSWDLYKDNLLNIFDIRGGGIAIYGGIIAGFITGFIITKIKKLPFLKVSDICIIGLPLGQAIGRWGNFFNREAFGKYYDGLFSMQIPISNVRSMTDVTKEMLSNAKVISKETFISVHPTFLYESIGNFLIFLFLMYLRKRIKFNGQLLLTYMVLYGILRFFVESLRTDQLLLWGTNIPVSKMLAGIIVVSSIILFIMLKIKRKHKAIK